MNSTISNRRISNRRITATALSAVLVSMLCACTINIYHNDTSNSGGAGLTDNPATSEKQNKHGATAAEIMSLDTSPVRPRISHRGSLALEVVLTVDAYVSCFYQQDTSEIIKLFPNRIIPLYRIKSGEVLRIPGANGFRVMTDKENLSDRFMCLATSEDVTPNLPLAFQASTFQPVPVASFDDLFDVFRQSTTENLVARTIEVKVQ